ncbi:hypothetical protein [uncultured Methanofollis sp.]|uniref:hypothetical protein n=1 Tax=uncultured Methanofollis sp. TaxID=262500 RepID=UPI00260969AE|nr:hypothetical protein [uncultured Methanofollis sp.]
MPDRWNLSECARKAVAFRDERGFREFNDPKNLAAALSIEAAEREMNSGTVFFCQADLSGVFRHAGMEDRSNPTQFLISDINTAAPND